MIDTVPPSLDSWIRNHSANVINIAAKLLSREGFNVLINSNGYPLLHVLLNGKLMCSIDLHRLLSNIYINKDGTFDHRLSDSTYENLKVTTCIMSRINVVKALFMPESGDARIDIYNLSSRYPIRFIEKI